MAEPTIARLSTLAALVCQAMVLASCAGSPVLATGRWHSAVAISGNKAITCGGGGWAKTTTAANYRDLFGTIYRESPALVAGADVRLGSYRGGSVVNLNLERGDVWVSVLVGPNDNVVAARVICSTNLGVDGVALEAAKRSQYRSQRVAGTPVQTIIDVPISVRVIGPRSSAMPPD